MADGGSITKSTPILGALVAAGGVAALAWAIWERQGASAAPPRPLANPAVVAASCVSTPVDPGVPAPELPAITQPLGENLRVVADKELDEMTRLKPLVDGSTVIITQPQDILLLRRILRDHREGDTLRNEAANALRVNESPDLAGDLQAVLADRRNGSRFRSFAAQHLGVLFEAAPAKDDLRQVMLGYLADSSVEVRREALWPLCKQGDPKALAQAEAWLRDPRQSAIHDLCCRIAAQAKRTDWLDAIRPLAKSSNGVIAKGARKNN